MPACGASGVVATILAATSQLAVAAAYGLVALNVGGCTLHSCKCLYAKAGSASKKQQRTHIQGGSTHGVGWLRHVAAFMERFCIWQGRCSRRSVCLGAPGSVVWSADEKCWGLARIHHVAPRRSPASSPLRGEGSIFSRGLWPATAVQQCVFARHLSPLTLYLPHGTAQPYGRKKLVELP